MDGGFCTACGAQVPEGSSFCGACGTRVQAAAPADSAVAPPPPAMPAETAIPAQPAPAPPAAMPPAPAAMATPPFSPPPPPASNPPWGKILSVLAGVGLLIFGGFKIYDAFFGAPISSSAVRQMEDKIRQDFQARGQQVGQVQMTARSRDRMTGSVTVGNVAVPASLLQYNCTATRQSGTYFAYQCEPASGTAGAATPMTPTPSSLAPVGASGPSAGTGLTAMTPAQRASLIARCTGEETELANPAAFCSCAVDRLAAGISRGQAVRECATQLGMPAPPD